MGRAEDQGRIFEWDDDKRELNVRNHSVDFGVAMLIWRDQNLQERLDFREYFDHHGNPETRWQAVGEPILQTEAEIAVAIGQYRGILFVVYTDRESPVDGTDVRHIISARLATREETRRYILRTFE